MDPYAAAGVDIVAGQLAVEAMRHAVEATHNSRVPEGLGGFAGLFDISFLKRYRSPLLVTSTDGVGTKVVIAQELDKHDTIGQDLVAMVVGDIAVVGGKPLFMTDYIACGELIPERIAQIVGGVARACQEIDCVLLGGETAEHPEVMARNQYDLAGAATGVVEASDLLGKDKVKTGDVLIGVASSGLHANGFSLVRKICRDVSFAEYCPDLQTTWGEALLEPTRMYVNLIRDLIKTGKLHAASHITGGGIPGNLPRILPEGLGARLHPWPIPDLFKVLCEFGSLSLSEVKNAWNLGIGLIIVASSTSILEDIDDSWQARLIGEVIDGEAIQWTGSLS